MQIEQLEAKAREAARQDCEAYFPKMQPGALMIAWDDVFEYYELSARGEPIAIDRDEAIDVLNNLQFQMARAR